MCDNCIEHKLKVVATGIGSDPIDGKGCSCSSPDKVLVTTAQEAQDRIDALVSEVYPECCDAAVSELINAQQLFGGLFVMLADETMEDAPGKALRIIPGIRMCLRVVADAVDGMDAVMEELESCVEINSEIVPEDER
jgi:hypothetical protein